MFTSFNYDVGIFSDQKLLLYKALRVRIILVEKLFLLEINIHEYDLMIKTGKLIQSYNNLLSLMQRNKIQLLRECYGKNHYDSHMLYKGKRLFNNRYKTYDCERRNFVC